MPPHHDDDEGPVGDDPLPPEDRLWRHPSELAAGVGPPAAWFESPRPGNAQARRSLLLGAVVGACLAGAVVAAGAMWLTRPTRVVQETPVAATAATAVQATYSFTPIPTERLARQFNPSLPSVRVERDGQWVAGSGVWIDDRGTVLTATPLLAGATTIMVTGIDGRSRKATITGSDPATGVSVLAAGRTSGSPLVFASAAVRSGEPVAVLSSPGALAGRSAKASAVSVAVIRMASMRNAVRDLVLHDSMQLDRTIPADAIGGLIVDAEGHPVGIAIGTSADRDFGVAAPSGDAVAAGEDLRDDGRVQRAWLGVRAVDLEPNLATTLHLAGGAQLTVVTKASPAARAGLRVGDVVTAVDNAPVGDASDLVLALRTLDPGELTTIAVRRDGRADDLVVRLGG